MRIKPRQELLDIWSATAKVAFTPVPGTKGKGEWHWGGRGGSNSISDAEQLLCLMLPATEIRQFQLDEPNSTDEDLLKVLRPFGGAIDIPQFLVGLVMDYLDRYTAPDGTPIFSGGSYFSAFLPDEEPTEEQRKLAVVESFAASIPLMLSSLGFIRVFSRSVTRPELRARLDKVEQAASRRLSAAMIGLLRSFSIFVFADDSDYAEALLRTVNQNGEPRRRVLEDLRVSLREVAAGLRDLTFGLTQVEQIEREDMLFECGWSWGVHSNATPVEFPVDLGQQVPGLALDAPYLYFTVVALDAIADLYNDRTRLLRLLDDDQLKLASALRLRWDLTQRYWSTVASFGTRRWPLEDIPWRTIDKAESDYFSLLVTSIAARNLSVRPNDSDLQRLGEILSELANRSRMTRRPLREDPALQLHSPGVSIEVEGATDFSPRLSWVAADFAPLLLKRAAMVAGMVDRIDLRGRALNLADDLWDHIALRRSVVDDGPGLWDDPSQVYPVSPGDQGISWHHTVRVVESLVLAARLADDQPLRSEPLLEHASSLLAEADHLYSQELLAGTSESGTSERKRLEAVRQRIRRAREIMSARPGTAVSLLLTALGELDSLVASRDTTEVF
ncbi:SCO2524 family protein [Catellatospora sp. KI3]|uniref:SCO2524 family protein n=1 Tax=Catellatospora sp. KI3 TaxID=3041620 RepID=UPI002482EE23|nr:SCO2524 family protein [Catellatospora sp. KI3]MDI1465190.1 SCO2524 family protein [Catellatospora sp. KI3]